jgi:adenosylhomocysteinase
MSTTTHYARYKVKDMSLANWGRTEIKLAEAETPGFMALCKDHADCIGVEVEGTFKPEHYRD